MNESMFCTMVNEYTDDELRHDERIAFEEHLIRCAACRDELERLLALQYQVLSLPKSIQPRRDLWPQIEASLRPEMVPMMDNIVERKNGKTKHGAVVSLPQPFAWYLRAAAVLLFLLAVGAVWLLLNTSQDRNSASGDASSTAAPTAPEQPSRYNIAEVPPHSAVVESPRSSPARVSGNTSLKKNSSVATVSGELRAKREMEELEKRLRRGLQLSTASLLPSSSGKIVGLVMDGRGKAVRGITVEILSIHRSALTDDNGKFEFYGLHPDAYTLQVQGLGYQRDTVSGVKIIPGFTTQVNFLLRSGSAALTDIAMNKEQLFANAATSASLDELPLASYARPSIQSNRLKVEGKVTDERGRSIVGAIVLVLGTKRGAYSDNEGKFHIYGVPPGTYTLQATASGFESKDTSSVQVFSDFSVEVNIALDPTEER